MSRWIIVLLSTAVMLGEIGAAPDRPSPVDLPGWGKAIVADQDCQIDISDNDAAVTITVPPTAHDFAAELQRWNAPRVIRKVRGDFVAEVKVSGSFNPSGGSTINGRRPYNGAGLIAIADDQNAVSLQRGAFLADGHVRHYLNFELRQDGKKTVSRFGMDIKNAPCWLRLERRAGKFYAMTSEDGVNWKSYPPAEAQFPDKLKVGIEAINSDQSQFECTFEKFAIYQSKPARNGG